MRLFDGVALANDLILGLDVGTSSVKALFINVAGAILKRVEVKIATTTSQNSVAEQNADDYLAALAEISKSNSNLIRSIKEIVFPSKSDFGFSSITATIPDHPG